MESFHRLVKMQNEKCVDSSDSNGKFCCNDNWCGLCCLWIRDHLREKSLPESNLKSSTECKTNFPLCKCCVQKQDHFARTQSNNSAIHRSTLRTTTTTESSLNVGKIRTVVLVIWLASSLIQTTFCTSGSDAEATFSTNSDKVGSTQLKFGSHPHSSAKWSTGLVKLSTAESIFPCLDTFDILLSRYKPGEKHKSPKYHHLQKWSHKLNSQHASAQSADQSTRQLVRVYWANKAVVDSIASAALQHLSSDPPDSMGNRHYFGKSRLAPHHQHFQHHHHHHHHHYSHHGRFVPKRPSMLIELRQLNYVREYSVSNSSELVRVRCDVFEPKESIFYCFIYLILYRNAVLYETLPHCVPTTQQSVSELNTINQQMDSNAANVHPKLAEINYSNINGLTPDYSWDGGNHSMRKYLNDEQTQMTFNQNSQSQLSLSKSQSSLNEWDRLRSMIVPPGSAYNSLRMGAHSRQSTLEESDNSYSVDSSNRQLSRDIDIKQFALKSDDLSQVTAKDANKVFKTRRKVLVQTQSCYCSPNARNSKDRSELVSTNVVTVNLSRSETTVVHLVISSCPVREADSSMNSHESGDSLESTLANTAIFDKDESFETAKQSASNCSNSNATASVESVPIDTESTDANEFESESSKHQVGKDKKHPNKKNTKHHLKKKRKKGKKNKKTENKETGKDTKQPKCSSEESPVPVSTSDQTEPMKLATEWPSDSEPTVCILSIENPHEYSLKLDNIEPSYNWPLELPSIGAHLSNGIDLIEYLHKFPFLVIRKGQFSIDPQMDIENRSQTHYLHSEHLRFEAMSSLNITLRFRRSALSSTFRSEGSPLSKYERSQNDDSETDPKNTSFSVAPLLQALRSKINQIVSFIAVKIVDQRKSQSSDSLADSHLYHLSSFHITSAILSLFIVFTLVVYVLIAVQGYKERHRHKLLQQTSEPEVNNNDHSVEQRNQDAQSEIEHSKKQDSHKSFSPEQQSLEMDYYDYSQPLMVHSTSGGSFTARLADKTSKLDCRKHSNLQSIVCSKEEPAVLNHRSSTNDQPMFRTLPIKVNSPNRKLSTNASVCSLVVSSKSAKNDSISDVINDNLHRHLPNEEYLGPDPSSSNISTLTRLSFTKPPVLLSTFARIE